MKYFLIHSLPLFNLPFIGACYVTHATRALQSHDLSGEEWNLGHIILFRPHEDMESFPGWGISSMSGPPPRQHYHERRIHTIHTPIHSKKKRWIWKDSYGGQMIFGDLEGIKFPDICLKDEEKPRKNITQENCANRGSNRVRCVTGSHATACFTAVDHYLC